MTQLEPDEVHIWWTRPAEDPALADGIEAVLSEDELLRLRRVTSPASREVRARLRAWLRHVIGPYCGVAPRDLVFDTATEGKPAVRRTAGMPDVRFNLSHSAEVAVLAVSQGIELGVDIEAVRERRNLDRLIEDWCSPQEQAHLRAVDPSRRLSAFLACWTRKEAYLKAMGTTESVDPTSFTVSIPPDEPARLISNSRAPEHVTRWHLIELDLADGFITTLAVPQAQVRVRCFGPADSA